ncbi:MAG: phenylalanine--tRNA ligase subunit beta [Phycisphaerae bacterium]|nr:phenylalanine--tRNA ligase subunit beta [Phycisphaerae bacterium]
MNISLNWLTDLLDLGPVGGVPPADQLGEFFTRIGLNCEGITKTDADVVFDLEVTSNRPDLLGHLGVARELAAATGATFTPAAIPELPTTGRIEEFTRVDVECPKLCPRYTARVIRGVTVKPSPSWLVERLEAVGLRSVNNVVDVTNYVLMEYSQPLHSFDCDKLADGRIVVRRGRDGETLTSIDETECRLTGDMCIIADAERPVAIAGVMGGLSTEVTGETTNVLIESAQFDPLTTRRTSRALGILSESNYRFERGVDPVAVETASRRACQLILDVAGGDLAGGLCDVWAEPFAAPEVILRPARCSALLGLDVPAERQAELLGRLDLSPRSDDGRIVCSIPPHRADLRREADLIEEVARLVGYDDIPVASGVRHAVPAAGRTQHVRRIVARTLAAAGFDEAVTFSFVDADEAVLFGFDAHVRVDPTVRRTNNVLRPTLLPSLLSACKTNQNAGNEDLRLYELAAVFPPHSGGLDEAGLPDERTDVALVTTGTLRSLRGAVEVLVEAVAPSARLEVRPTEITGLAAGGEVLLDGAPVGIIGRASGAVLDYYGLVQPVTCATVALGPLMRAAELIRTYQPLPSYPAVERDLSLVVDESVTWQELSAAITAVEQPLRVGLDYVTAYRGKPIAAGRKSVTVRLSYRSDESTLRGEQVDEQVAAVTDALSKTLSAELRA